MKAFHSEDALRAVLALRQNTDFQRFVTEVGLMLEDRNKRLIHTNEPNAVFVEQGAVRVLTEIVDAVAYAPERLHKMQQRS